MRHHVSDWDCIYTPSVIDSIQNYITIFKSWAWENYKYKSVAAIFFLYLSLSNFQVKDLLYSLCFLLIFLITQRQIVCILNWETAKFYLGYEINNFSRYDISITYIDTSMISIPHWTIQIHIEFILLKFDKNYMYEASKYNEYQ